MKSGNYNFLVGTDLRVRSWNNNIRKLTGKAGIDVIGRKYYKVIPRLFVDGRDAISMAAKKKGGLTIQGCDFISAGGPITADIELISASNAVSDEIRVRIFPQPVSSVKPKNELSQQLIDIGKMASTLAHGVRNPLNAIKGAMVYLSEKYADEPSFVEFAEIINEEILRLDRFISRFLSTSVANAETLPTDINALLRKIAVFTSLQAYACNVRATYDYGEIPSVVIDAFQLEQAILNVVNNAMESMTAGGELKVKTYLEKHADRDFVVIGISDTGRGIPDGKGARFLATQRKRGKGFGLFITREILQYYGGRLEMRSIKGKGTVVRLYVPAAGDGVSRA
jgi:two-component system nitrogen regulation sensor histidine kinase GlnL